MKTPTPLGGFHVKQHRKPKMSDSKITPADFVKAGDYYADMVDTVKREARAKIEELATL